MQDLLQKQVDYLSNIQETITTDNIIQFKTQKQTLSGVNKIVLGVENLTSKIGESSTIEIKSNNEIAKEEKKDRVIANTIDNKHIEELRKIREAVLSSAYKDVADKAKGDPVFLSFKNKIDSMKTMFGDFKESFKDRDSGKITTKSSLAGIGRSIASSISPRYKDKQEFINTERGLGNTKSSKILNKQYEARSSLLYRNEKNERFLEKSRGYATTEEFLASGSENSKQYLAAKEKIGRGLSLVDSRYKITPVAPNVAGIAPNVAPVAPNVAGVTPVAPNVAGVTPVAPNVAGVAGVTPVAGVAPNVAPVAPNVAGVTPVAPNVAGVTPVAPNVAGVAGVTPVAGVAPNVAGVTPVAPNVAGVAPNVAGVTPVAPVAPNVAGVAPVAPSNVINIRTAIGNRLNPLESAISSIRNMADSQTSNITPLIHSNLSTTIEDKNESDRERNEFQYNQLEKSEKNNKILSESLIIQNKILKELEKLSIDKKSGISDLLDNSILKEKTTPRRNRPTRNIVPDQRSRIPTTLDTHRLPSTTTETANRAVSSNRQTRSRIRSPIPTNIAANITPEIRTVTSTGGGVSSRARDAATSGINRVTGVARGIPAALGATALGQSTLGNVVRDATPIVSKAAGAARKVVQVLSKVPGLGAILTAANIFMKIDDLDEQVKSGTLPETEYKKEVTKAIGSALGSTGGAIAGAALGTLGGGPIGTIVGGITGGLGGDIAGEKIAGVVFDMVSKDETPTLISGEGKKVNVLGEEYTLTPELEKSGKSYGIKTPEQLDSYAKEMSKYSPEMQLDTSVQRDVAEVVKMSTKPSTTPLINKDQPSVNPETGISNKSGNTYTPEFQKIEDRIKAEDIKKYGKDNGIDPHDEAVFEAQSKGIPMRTEESIKAGTIVKAKMDESFKANPILKPEVQESSDKITPSVLIPMTPTLSPVKPTTIVPSSANMIYDKSSENSGAQSTLGNTIINNVSSPMNVNNSNSSNPITLDTYNRDSSVEKLFASRLKFN